MNKCEVTNVSAIPYSGMELSGPLEWEMEGLLYFYHLFSIMHMSIICEDDVWSIREATSMDLLQVCVLHSLVPLQDGLQSGHFHTCSELQLQ